MFVINTIFYLVLVKSFIRTYPFDEHLAPSENNYTSKTLNGGGVQHIFPVQQEDGINENYSRFTETHEQPIRNLTSYDHFEEINTLISTNKKENFTNFIAELNEVLPEVLNVDEIRAKIEKKDDNKTLMNESMFDKYFIQLDTEELLKTYDRSDSDYSIEDNSNNNDIPTWYQNTRRIFQGHRVSIKDYPFMASVHIFQDFQCAGTIIAADLILTAASCLQLIHNNRFFRENPKLLSVRVGSSFTMGGGESIDVMEVFFCPGYDPRTLSHNLAIMRLERWLSFKKSRVKKIKLDTHESSFSGGIVSVLGWGAISRANVLQHPFKNTLRFDELYPYHNSDCKDIYSRTYITERNFCAGFTSKGGGACNHDVGGPGIVDGHLIGVISFGSPQCGKRDMPTVFTKVGFYQSWIDEIMSQPVPTGYKRTTLHQPISYSTINFEIPTTFKIDPIVHSKHDGVTVQTAASTTTMWMDTASQPDNTGWSLEPNQKQRELSKKEILEMAAYDETFYKMLMKKLREKHKTDWNWQWLRAQYGNHLSLKTPAPTTMATYGSDESYYNDDVNTSTKSFLKNRISTTRRKRKKITTTTSPFTEVVFGELDSSYIDETRKVNKEVSLDIENKMSSRSSKKQKEVQPDANIIFKAAEVALIKSKAASSSKENNTPLKNENLNENSNDNSWHRSQSDKIKESNDEDYTNDPVDSGDDNKIKKMKISVRKAPLLSENDFNRSEKNITIESIDSIEENLHKYHTEKINLENSGKTDKDVTYINDHVAFRAVSKMKCKPHKNNYFSGWVEYYEDTDTFTQGLLNDCELLKTTKKKGKIKTTTTTEPDTQTNGIFSDYEETRKANKRNELDLIYDKIYEMPDDSTMENNEEKIAYTANHKSFVSNLSDNNFIRNNRNTLNDNLNNETNVKSRINTLGEYNKNKDTSTNDFVGTLKSALRIKCKSNKNGPDDYEYYEGLLNNCQIAMTTKMKTTTTPEPDTQTEETRKSNRNTKKVFEENKKDYSRNTNLDDAIADTLNSLYANDTLGRLLDLYMDEKYI